MASTILSTWLSIEDDNFLAINPLGFSNFLIIIFSPNFSLKICSAFPTPSISPSFKDADPDQNSPVKILFFSGSFSFAPRLFLTRLIKEKALIGVYNEDGKLIAHIGYTVQGKASQISCISITREYQGQGLAYVLYNLFLVEVKKKGIKVFNGYSSTTKVLKQAKKIGREVYTEYLVF